MKTPHFKMIKILRSEAIFTPETTFKIPNFTARWNLEHSETDRLRIGSPLPGVGASLVGALFDPLSLQGERVGVRVLRRDVVRRVPRTRLRGRGLALCPM